MSGNGLPEMIWYVGALVLVGSALVARRMKFSQAVRYILIWLAIFAVAYGVFLFRDDLSSVWQRARADMGGSAEAGIEGDTVVLRRAPDGHFWVNATVNDTKTRFLVDSGATMTSVSRSFADRAGIEVDQGGFPVLIDTANGETYMQRGTIGRMEIGSISIEDHPVLVGDAIGEIGVLGMNFLSQLKSWRVEGTSLTLEP